MATAPVVGMNNPAAAQLAAAQPSVAGFNPINWIDPQRAADGFYSANPFAAAYRQYLANGRSTEGLEVTPAMSDAFQQFDEQAAGIDPNEVGYYADATGNLASQGINTQFTGSQGIQYLTGQQAAAQGLDPNRQYMLVHQTDPRATGSGNRTQAMVLYQRDPSSGQAVPVWAGDGFQGADPSASNRQLGLMFASALGFGALGASGALGAADGAAGTAVGSGGSAGTTTAAEAFRAAEIASMNAGGAGAGGAAIAPSGVNLVNAGGVMSTGLGSAGAGLGTSGVDAFRAGEIASSNAGGAGQAIVPSGVDLVNAGGVMSTQGGMTLADAARYVNNIRNAIGQGQPAAGGGAAGSRTTSSSRGTDAASMASALQDRTQFQSPDLESVYGLSTKDAKQPAGGDFKPNPADPIDQNGLQIASIQALTKRIARIKARIAQHQGDPA